MLVPFEQRVLFHEFGERLAPFGYFDMNLWIYAMRP